MNIQPVGYQYKIGFYGHKTTALPEELSEDAINSIVDTIDEKYKIYGYGTRESLIKALKSNNFAKMPETTRVAPNTCDSARRIAYQEFDSSGKVIRYREYETAETKDGSIRLIPYRISHFFYNRFELTKFYNNGNLYGIKFGKPGTAYHHIDYTAFQIDQGKVTYIDVGNCKLFYY